MVVMGRVAPAVPPSTLEPGAITPLGMPGPSAALPQQGNYVYGTPITVPPLHYGNDYGSSVYYTRCDYSDDVSAFSAPSTTTSANSRKDDGHQ
ncbi:hypothetical protein ABL78_7611 [Leptomonas seymouri]|uniref:Uncharacterized protein n=1 Tax=Leptomonas seymouri TaxID=5684 RepID=A0A0N1HZB4_LEPSE|nr:hypothetical protein ABL78_7611 [Leptomonas seymouri]|eukprot:KPI83363.1 hypothetical protein ABL78_7611 [Leptomonas seymouri]